MWRRLLIASFVSLTCYTAFYCLFLLKPYLHSCGDWQVGSYLIEATIYKNRLPKKNIFYMLIGSSLTTAFLFAISTSSVLSSKSRCNCGSPNVRTVLWRQEELNRLCWNENDMALLYARRLFQLVLPKRIPCDMNLLMSHFKMCFNVVRKYAVSKRSHALLVSALADTIGGYLQAFGVPLANQMYYEGNLGYCSTLKVNELLSASKKLLDTDGGGWTKPIYVKRSRFIQPYVIPVPATMGENLCFSVITNYDLGKCNMKKYNPKKDPATLIPLPYLDNDESPASIAVPFREQSLYSLFAKNSSDILIRYYTAALHCFLEVGEAKKLNMKKCKGFWSPEAERFSIEFHKWLIAAVFPHLHDNTWYAGFGGVYRIMETLYINGNLKWPKEKPDDFFAITLPTRHKKCRPTLTIFFFIACVLLLLLFFWCAISAVFCLRSSNYFNGTHTVSHMSLCSCSTCVAEIAHSESKSDIMDLLMKLNEETESSNPSNVSVHGIDFQSQDNALKKETISPAIVYWQNDTKSSRTMNSKEK